VLVIDALLSWFDASPARVSSRSDAIRLPYLRTERYREESATRIL
jgi:hypothetical protein